MAIRVYLYKPQVVAADDLTPLLALAASPTVGSPLGNSLVPITIDDSHKEDLDDAMRDLGYDFVEEYTGGPALTPRQDFGVLAADPTGLTVGDGDRYYNSTLDMEMRYDSVRAKWLSVETAAFQFGRDGNTRDGVYYRAASGRIMGVNRGWRANYNGTLVSLAYTRDGVDAATFEVVANGTTLATLLSTATAGEDNTFNADFNAGDILAVLNQVGSNQTRDVIGFIRVHWRS